MAIELVFETHSMSVDNEQGRATGWWPGQLSERGRAQARELGRRRSGDGLAAVFSSDLARAAETASAAFAGSAIPVLYDWRLRECDYGQITAELASNAILHSPSGSSGGEFTLTVRIAPGWARVEVSDSGTGQWSAPRDGSDEDEYGRGLAIVAALADKLGHDIRAGGQTVWAEVAW